MGYALLFSGQGLQHAAMLPWLAPDLPELRTVAETLGVDWRERLADPEQASRNAYAQPALTGMALAAWRQLRDRLPPPQAIAGYSVGELAAFSAAGALDASAAQALASARARVMDDCARQVGLTGLLAVGGLSRDSCASLCQRHGLDVAIDSGDPWILGGPRAALLACQPDAEALGARCTPLRVELASHTHWMHPASLAFARLLAQETTSGPASAAPAASHLQRPARVLYANATGRRVLTAEDAERDLAAQISQTVRWADCLQGIAERRVECVLEIGAGSALARQWNERFPAIPARSADEFRSADALIHWMDKHLGRA